MTQKQLTKICEMLKLEVPVSEPSRVYGGLLHLMWRVNTSKASYAIKQISSEINMNNENIRKNYELTEQIALRFFKQDIPAISAIEYDDKHLIEIDQAFFLVYPWVDGQIANKNTISEHHALIIAGILAKMHAINLQMIGLKETYFDVHTTNSLVELIDMAQTCNVSFAHRLQAHKFEIMEINNTYQKATILLQKNAVISHGDLDPKNVLWNNKDQPILIDWESARKLNPTYDIVNVSLDWSGITSNHFDQELFRKMMHTYKTTGGIIDKDLLQASFYGVMGNWMHWMVYNIKRACLSEESEEKNVAVEQVNLALSTIIRIKNNMHNLMVRS